CHLEVEREIVPERDRPVLFMHKIFDVIDPALGKLLRSFVIDLLDILCGTTIVLAADVERQQTRLARGIDLALGTIEVPFCEAMLFQDVTPATCRDLKIES